MLKPALTNLVLLALLMGCTFEQRGNGDDMPTSVPEALTESDATVEPRLPGPTATVRAFRDAVAVGDLALALAFLDRQAFFVDDLVGDPDVAGSRGEALLELRARLAEGLSLQEESSRVNLSGDGAVVLSRLRLEVSEDAHELTRSLHGRVLTETVVLVVTEEGWRIGHFHRSLLAES
ncbi:MAG: DUF4440 domain-containing protein [Gemmatimonadales bacterium]|nr:MAG: DUF4440 domain-containing protein [Gemmatimonadales bacterium]